MQTFLPYSEVITSASCLDYRRLGKQRLEAFQIWNTLTGRSSGWLNHPATKMWRGYENFLAFYTNCMIAEWQDRGYKNNMAFLPVGRMTPPFWFGDEKFHASHRSNLLRKDPVWYGRFEWEEPNDLPYVWPV